MQLSMPQCIGKLIKKKICHPKYQQCQDLENLIWLIRGNKEMFLLEVLLIEIVIKSRLYLEMSKPVY